MSSTGGGGIQGSPGWYVPDTKTGDSTVCKCGLMRWQHTPTFIPPERWHVFAIREAAISTDKCQLCGIMLQHHKFVIHDFVPPPVYKSVL